MPATGESVLQLAEKHIGDKYVLGVLVPKNNANWTGPWDCAEFASWLVFQASTTIYGCDRDFGEPATADAYTGFWERDAKSLGQIIAIEQAARTPGAAVLRMPQVGAIGHVVISDGLGGTVEAHSSATGVIASTLSGRRWDIGILVPGIAYAQGLAVEVAAPKTAIFRLATPLMAGPEVRGIQQALKTAGFDAGSIDGEFGPHTHAAVVAFQLTRGLLPDGEVGSQTAQALGVTVPVT
jgi:N-acetylmuramoyl-L-alanine amidase